MRKLQLLVIFWYCVNAALSFLSCSAIQQHHNHISTSRRHHDGHVSTSCDPVVGLTASDEIIPHTTIKSALMNTAKQFKEVVGYKKEQRTKAGKKEWRYLGRLAASERRLLLFSAVVLILGAVCEIAVPHYFSRALHAGVFAQDQAAFWGYLKDSVLVTVLSALFTGLRVIAFWLAGNNVVARVRYHLFTSLLNKDIAFFDSNEVGDLTSRLSSDTAKISNVVTFHVSNIARQSLQALGGCLYLMWLCPPLALVTIAGMVGVSVITSFSGRFSRGISKQIQGRMAEAGSVAQQSLSMVRVIRAFASERHEALRYGDKIKDTLNLQEAQGVAYGGARVVLGLLKAAVKGAVLCIGSQMVFSGQLSGERLTSFIFYVNFITSASFDVGDQWTKIQEALGGGAKVIELIEENESKADRRSATTVTTDEKAADHQTTKDPTIPSWGNKNRDSAGVVTSPIIAGSGGLNPNADMLNGSALRASANHYSSSSIASASSSASKTRPDPNRFPEVTPEEVVNMERAAHGWAKVEQVQEQVPKLAILDSTSKALGPTKKILQHRNDHPQWQGEEDSCNGVTYNNELLFPSELPFKERDTIIEFRNCEFSYPTRPGVRVLNGLNMRIRRGEKVALVGTSGEGKSTIFRLLSGFYNVEQGQVVLNGRDLNTYSTKELSRRIASVTQEPQLWNLSIEKNIAYGLDESSYTDEDVMRAAVAANCHEFILAQPHGYQTMVGTGGGGLSGGQKQRVAIARALIRNPELLLLDEATSSLDAVNEKLVQAALDKASEGRTVLIIAHRLPTVKNADTVIFLKDGRVAEMGPPDVLLRKGGLFADLYGEGNASAGMDKHDTQEEEGATLCFCAAECPC